MVAAYNCLSKIFGQAMDRNPMDFDAKELLPLKNEPNFSLTDCTLKNDDRPVRC